MLGRRKWAETSGVTGISSHIAIIRISFIYYSGLEFDVVNLMSDLLSHWLSVPRLPATSSLILAFFTDPSLLVLLIIPIDLQRARKPFWSLEHWCAIKS